ncbi:glutaredoxin family protein [Kinneretia aquatilis]|uniref:glutaredoxin family protein n=1 Tax=Kinneretia aquatilis TaxID=2070761 RepID=UPI0014952A48|nr:glutaredoxin family protein [Paucibacter aquatile]WIV99648.1 glutaredoxin family protein [Paucibacter aquatile]
MKRRFFNVQLSWLAIVGCGLGVGVAIPRIPKFLESNSVVGDYSPYQQKHQSMVLLYGTAACSFCRSARGFLSERKIEFADLDVQRSTQASQEHRSLGGGGVPLVLIGNHLIRGFHPDLYSDALRSLMRD